MDESLRLPPNRIDNLRMRVSGRHHGNPGCEIQIAIAVDILDDGTARFGDDQGIDTGG
jgi:hypothetical protein